MNGIQLARRNLCLLLLANVLTTALGRGPHHPSGQPVGAKHHHYKPRGDTLTSDTQLLHDAKHIEEDSPGLSEEALSKMSPEELEFHYFSAHDFDKNSKLDGLELLKAVYHTMEHEPADPDADNSIEPESNALEAYIALVDRTLALDDTDGDGFVSYAEYRAARAHQKPEKHQHTTGLPTLSVLPGNEIPVQPDPPTVLMQ